ncbi:chromosome segregation ATPase-like protein [Tropicimonas sp. TH_r6]|uniref:McrB family protein n=1 Tax=Tropicimonas sp. TH_r6 TaxID=3082085 RepID=UPI002955C147|nr:chromosome segregation ATPase-like protein [Tropicimonas sp. TH_r6]MDV7142018.1 chromosome segregation ATPase-like protein [Tropicimonas sp. TH_r6]
MGQLLLTVLLVGFALLALVIVMVVVSWRADHANTIKGPLATIGELEAQIGGKNNTLTELEDELQKRREAIKTVADIQAEVDSLIRQREELQQEWMQLEERREEVLALRQETDEAQTALSTVTRDLQDKAAELEKVETRLSRAEQLVSQISQLEDDQARLEKEVEDLRANLSDLQTLQTRERELHSDIERLERDTARLTGETEAFRNRRSEAEEAAGAAQERVERIKAHHLEEATKLASAQTEIARIDSQRAELLAQIEAMKGKTGAGGAAGAGGEEDPLAEMRVLPPVLADMRDWPERDREIENEALYRVSVHMKALGLEFHTRVIRAFHTAMKVNETTQMAVLAGISGTGKSQLPRRYAQAMGIGFQQVPVQPRWDSPQDLMGFFNYIEGKFRPTDLAQALYHLDQYNGPEESRDFQEHMMLILLDEMNLARVEYYFSDFLSRLESRPGIGEAGKMETRKDAELFLDIPMPEGQVSPRIFPGYNVLFAGTMNEDESTQSLSDKVVDRANVMRFAAPRSIRSGAGIGDIVKTEALSRSQWSAWVRTTSSLGTDLPAVEQHLDRMVNLMSSLGKPFGHRLGRAIMAYAANYPSDNDRRDVRTALADQVEMRLLPKLRGVEMETAGGTIQDLSGFIENDLGDAVLAEGVRESARIAEDTTGQFIWRGVSRE